MNVIQLQDMAKNLSDQQIAKEMQTPSGSMPGYVLLSEAMRRKRMRETYAAQQEQPKQSMAEEMSAQMSGGIGSLQQAPQQSMGQPMAQPQGFAGGGGVTPSIMNINVTPADAHLMARLLQAEVGAGKSADDYYPVIETILNRTASDRFPNSIAEVINQKNQFTPVWDGSMPDVADPEIMGIVESFLTGDNTYEPTGATFFQNPEGSDRLFPAAAGGIDPLYEAGGHMFYDRYNPDDPVTVPEYNIAYDGRAVANNPLGGSNEDPIANQPWRQGSDAGTDPIGQDAYRAGLQELATKDSEPHDPEFWRKMGWLGRFFSGNWTPEELERWNPEPDENLLKPGNSIFEWGGELSDNALTPDSTLADVTERPVYPQDLRWDTGSDRGTTRMPDFVPPEDASVQPRPPGGAQPHVPPRPYTPRAVAEDTTDILTENEPRSDGGVMDLIKQIRASHEEDRDWNKNMALAQMGLAMASGRSPNWLTNVAEGGLYGAEALAKSEQQYRDNALSEAALAGDLMSIDVQREALNRKPDELLFLEGLASSPQLLNLYLLTEGDSWEAEDQVRLDSLNFEMKKYADEKAMTTGEDADRIYFDLVLGMSPTVRDRILAGFKDVTKD